MTFSNLVAFFIMLTTAVTCTRTASPTSDFGAGGRGARPHRRGVRVSAVRCGHRRDGMLAVPVLAGSAAYAVAESFRCADRLG